MSYIEDDVKEFTVNLISDKLLSISDVIYNEDVDINEPFTISYRCNNLSGYMEECYGVIVNKDTNKPLKNTYWQELLVDTKDLSHTFTGTEKKLNLQIRIGLAWIVESVMVI